MEPPAEGLGIDDELSERADRCLARTEIELPPASVDRVVIRDGEPVEVPPNGHLVDPQFGGDLRDAGFCGLAQRSVRQVRELVREDGEWKLVHRHADPAARPHAWSTSIPAPSTP